MCRCVEGEVDEGLGEEEGLIDAKARAAAPESEAGKLTIPAAFKISSKSIPLIDAAPGASPRGPGPVEFFASSGTPTYIGAGRAPSSEESEGARRRVPGVVRTR